MPTRIHHDFRARLAEYTDQSGKPAEDDSLVIPENLSELSDADLAELSEKATAAFQDLYDAGSEDGFTDEALTELSSLTEGIEALGAESNARAQAAAERTEKAAELAARIGKKDEEDDGAPADESSDDSGDGEDDSDEEDKKKSAASEGTEDLADGPEGLDEPDSKIQEEAESVAASGSQPVKRRTTRINLSGVRRQAMSGAEHKGTRKELATAAPDVPGFAMGQSMSLRDMAVAVDKRMSSAGVNTFASAASAGRHIRQQYPIATIHKDFKGLVVNDPATADEVIARASDESQLDGGSLVASGGWCAPSETMYDLFDDGSSREGLISLPEVQVNRGGIRFTKGPDYTSIYAEGIGFHYTEANDIAGQYGVDADGNGNGTDGTKPCFKIGCTEFEEKRLELDGLCISAGLLEARGYPELISRTIELALIAHDHRLSARKISELVAGSTAVTMPSPQVGVTAPVLTAIELQVQHYRYSHRLPQATTLEAVLPFWVRGAVRSDLSRRLGIDFINVTDATINSWFSARGISAQFVYDWQALDTTAATGFTAWPTTVQFLLYKAGTWVGGGSDVITLNNLYDSTQLGENDYTALFTEEGYLIAKKGLDSRVVTVPLSASGETGAGVLINHNGTEVASGS